jgi:hypothetical protein
MGSRIGLPITEKCWIKADGRSEVERDKVSTVSPAVAG